MSLFSFERRRYGQQWTPHQSADSSVGFDVTSIYAPYFPLPSRRSNRRRPQAALLIHDRLFRKTRTSLAINSWDVIADSPTHHRTSFEPTCKLVTWARELMGERLALQNNGTGPEAGWPKDATPRTNHFCFLNASPGPKGFQTRTLARLGGTQDGLGETLDQTLKMGADFVELPSGFQQFDAAWLESYGRQLESMPFDVPGLEQLTPGKSPARPRQESK